MMTSLWLLVVIVIDASLPCVHGAATAGERSFTVSSVIVVPTMQRFMIHSLIQTCKIKIPLLLVSDEESNSLYQHLRQVRAQLSNLGFKLFRTYARDIKFERCQFLLITDITKVWYGRKTARRYTWMYELAKQF